MENKESVIKKLKEFKDLLNIWEYGRPILGRMNVAAIVKGDIEIPTDINGVVYIGVDNSEAWKILLAKEIKAAGFNIDLNKLL